MNIRSLIIIATLGVIPLVLHFALLHVHFGHSRDPVVAEESLRETRTMLEKTANRLNRQLAAKTPGSCYLVINSAANEFSLYKGKQLIRRDKCSTGSYVLLKNGEQQQWMFSTPKGEFRIQGKTTSPVWRKPDWAFIEEGLPVPTENHYSRYEAGVLGDYALSLGHGYLIHGTLYQRFLGLPVTHGCIRLSDANLELVYRSLPLGSKVYIF
jgi:L,D-transpeptidase ErfK/SrfK